jgi:hypothetical protein
LPGSTWDVIGTIVQIGAILFGGWWAYRGFVRGRLKYLRATLRHSISHFDLDDGRRFLRVETTINNTGSVLLRLIDAIFRVDRVLPLPMSVERDLQTEAGPELENGLQIRWPPVSDDLLREHQWAEGMRPELEPGESDVIICDFIVPGELKTVQVYTYFKNSKKGRWRWRPWRWKRGREEIGWPLSTFYDFKGRTVPQAIKEIQDMTGGPERHE